MRIAKVKWLSKYPFLTKQQIHTSDSVTLFDIKVRKIMRSLFNFVTINSGRSLEDYLIIMGIGCVRWGYRDVLSEEV
jgi:hypothetical protein